MSVGKNWWLYILELENGKFYVGITSKDPKDRFAEHLAKQRAAYWTMRHKPVRVELIEDLGVVSKSHAEKYENKITRSLIRERGLNNVRGGDLRDVGEYVKRFGYIYRKNDWNSMATSIVCLASLVLNIILIWIIAFD